MLEIDDFIEECAWFTLIYISIYVYCEFDFSFKYFIHCVEESIGKHTQQYKPLEFKM